jgi:ankyrin repeat protein
MGTLIPAFETYQYTSLRSVDSAFRLLKLLKYRVHELECELFPQSLSNNEHVSYEALSYVWGSTELVECIILNQKRHWITDNLHSALQCLRLHDRDRYLWIDAICIDQVNKEEQGSQVQQMGKIFSSAEGVLFWLGKATSEITSLMDTLNQHLRAGADCQLGQLTLDDDCRNKCRTGLRQLLHRQWFTRVWILQEVANARKATVCSGTWSIPAEVFACAPSIIREEPEPHCQPILEIMPRPSRSGSWWGQKRDLYTLLRRFPASKATDERDKIYALLGMSSNPLDTQIIDIDYQKPTHEVIHRAVTYLLRSTPASVHEILNLMCCFETLETTYFVLPSGQEEATEILFPHLQSGNVLNMPTKPKAPDFISQGIVVVDDPALFLFEKRPERSSKEEERCHSQVVGLVQGHRTNESQEHEKYNKGLRVISWGSPEHQVKIVVINDRKKAVLQAALQGYAHIVGHLLHLKVGDEEGEKLKKDALQDAIHDGLTLAVQTILHQVSHLPVQGGQYDNGLQTASLRGHEQVVKLLLDKGADVNAQGGEYGNALQAASLKGRAQVVKLLLDKGADVNAQGGKYGNTLLAASVEGHEQVVKLLLDKGADVNAQGGGYGNALQAASLRSHEQVVKLLLDKGADVNAQGGEYGNALQAASLRCRAQVVKLLLDKGADVNAQGGEYGNALQAALVEGHEHLVKLLLDKSADINAQGGKHGYTLQAASDQGREQVVKLLLDKDADVNAQGGKYGNALQAALVEGHEHLVKLLLDKSADINAQGGEYGNALQAASLRGRAQVVKLLLDKGADVNVQGGKYGNALQAASLRGHEHLVKLLLDKGADVNAQGGEYGNALEAALYGGHEQVGKLLLIQLKATRR